MSSAALPVIDWPLSGAYRISRARKLPFRPVRAVALVTGASRGIGSAIANALAEHGAQVVLSSRKQADLDAEAERINARFPSGRPRSRAHAGRPEDLERLVKTVMERLSRIDILVNNAGTNPYFGPCSWTLSWAPGTRRSRSTCVAYFVLTKLVYEASMEAHGGAIVNIASIGGLRPGLGLGVYNVTKAGASSCSRGSSRASWAARCASTRSRPG